MSIALRMAMTCPWSSRWRRTRDPSMAVTMRRALTSHPGGASAGAAGSAPMVGTGCAAGGGSGPGEEGRQGGEARRGRAQQVGDDGERIDPLLVAGLQDAGDDVLGGGP